MRLAVVAGFIALGTIGVIACALPPVDASLDTDNTDYPRTLVPEASPDPGPGTDGAQVTSDASTDAPVDAGIDAASLYPSGTYTGTYTNNRPNGGCNFMNAGNLSATFTLNGAELDSTADVTGLQILDLDSCGQVGRENGSAPSSAVTVSMDAGADTFTGTWNVKVNDGYGNLSLPFTAKLSGKTITGSWTCTSCTGSFSITAP